MRSFTIAASVLALSAVIVGAPDLPMASAAAASTSTLGKACPDNEICVYPKPNFIGRPRVVEPGGLSDDSTRCVKFPVASVINNAFPLVDGGDAQNPSPGSGTGRVARTVVRVYDNPFCSKRAPHKTATVENNAKAARIQFPGSSAPARSFKLVTIITKP